MLHTFLFLTHASGGSRTVVLFGIGVAPVTAVENRSLEWDAHDVRIHVLCALAIIQHLHEEKVSLQLLNRYGVRAAACPKVIPNIFNAVLDFASNHEKSPKIQQYSV